MNQPTITPEETPIETSLPNISSKPSNSVCNAVKHTFLPFLKKHPFTFVFAAAGVIIASLMLIIGFWATFLIGAFASLGIALGSYFDGNLVIKSYFTNLFRRFK